MLRSTSFDLGPVSDQGEEEDCKGAGREQTAQATSKMYEQTTYEIASKRSGYEFRCMRCEINNKTGGERWIAVARENKNKQQTKRDQTVKLIQKQESARIRMLR